MSAKRTQGFTLIETIFSSLFIGVAVLAIINLFPGAYLSIRKSEMQIQSDVIAKSILDEVRITPFNQLDLSYPPDDMLLEGGPFAPRVVDNVEYTPTVQIYEVPGAAFDVLKGVKVTVEYVHLNDIARSQKQYVLDTYVHKLIR